MEPFLFTTFKTGFPAPGSRNSLAPLLLCGDARAYRERTDPMVGIHGCDALLVPLRGQIQEVLATRIATTIHEDLLKLLGRPGYALHADGLCRAGTLALTVHEAVSREPIGKTALLAAAAVELQMEAAFVFDEVADESPSGTRSEDLGLAIALLTAGAAAAVEAAADSPDRTAAMDHFCRAYSEACAGQFLDAALQGRGKATLEEALQMTCLKSGGLGRFVTGFVARIAGADGGGVALFERFGDHTFTLAQLVDDLRDACAPGQTSDLAQRKATLPVVFYGRAIDSRAPMDGILAGCNTYESSGAPLYAAILAHAYMSRAEEDLTLLARRGYAVGGLIGFLESVDSGAGATLGTAQSTLVA
jgi:geranylgeranyl pyrophosphate synthase